MLKRHVLHRDEYTPEEKIMMANVHKSFRNAMRSEAIPDILKMAEDGTKSLHRISEDELKKKTWVRQIEKKGLLTSKADAMIGSICDYIQGRVSRFMSISTGNKNDPHNLVCCELLHWLTHTLSGAPCNQQTLDNVKARIVYIDDLRGLFPPEDWHKHKMKTALDELKVNLLGPVTRTIKREIANTHATEHLESLQELGKIILDFGFQIAYYVFTNVPNVPSANMTRFRKQEDDYLALGQTKLGKTLLACIRTVDYKQFFSEQYEETPSTQSNSSFDSLSNPRKLSTMAIQTSNNPFLNKRNQLCVPWVLGTGSTIQDYFKVPPNKPNDTGIYPAILEKPELIESLLRFLSLLIELSKIFAKCGEAKALAGIGGDLLIYGFSNEQTTRTMTTLIRCSEALTIEQKKMISGCNTIFSKLTEKATTDTQANKVWGENISDKVASLQIEFEKYLKLSIEQAKFVTERAREVLTKEWAQEAEQQTKQYVESTMRLNHEIDYILAGRPTPDFDPANLPWNKVVALSDTEDGVPRIELLEDESDKKADAKPELKQRLRTSLKDLFNIGKKEDEEKVSKDSTENDTTADPSKKEQLSRSRNNSLSDLFKISGKGSKKGAPSTEGNDANDEATAETPKKEQLSRSRNSSLSDLFKLPGKGSKKGTSTPALREEEAAPQSSPASVRQPLIRRPSATGRRLSMLFKKEGSATPAEIPVTPVADSLPGSVTNSPAISRARPVQRKMTGAPPMVAPTTSTNPFVSEPANELHLAVAAASVAQKPAVSQQVIAVAVIPKALVLKVDLSGNKSSYLDDSNVCWVLQQKLSRNPKVKEIQLQQNKITSKYCNNIGTLLGSHKSLEVIDLRFNTLEDHGAIAICNAATKLPNLRVLNLAGNSIKGSCKDVIVQLLTIKANNKEPFEILDLSSNDLDDNAAIAICNAAATNAEFTQLTTVLLGDNKKLSEQCAPAILALLTRNKRIINFSADGVLSENTLLEIHRLLKNNAELVRQAQSDRKNSTQQVGNNLIKY